jgi:hypothetical protein
MQDERTLPSNTVSNRAALKTEPKAIRLPSLRMQVQLMDMVYRKALRLNSGDVAAKGVGAIVNLQSNDVKKVEFLPVFMHSVWEGPMQVRSDGQSVSRSKGRLMDASMALTEAKPHSGST